MIEQIRKFLKNNKDEKYAKFNKKLAGKTDTTLAIGVRVPTVKALAKQLVKNNEWGEYLSSLDKLVQAKQKLFREEIMLYGMIIGFVKCDDFARQNLLEKFIPLIDTWETCDTPTSTHKFLKKNQNFWFVFLQKYLSSKSEFEIRYAIVALMDNFLNEMFIDDILKIYSKKFPDFYYVNMAIAWGLSFAYIKFPDKTIEIFKKKILSEFIHKKAIQKCCESFRVTEEQKRCLKTLI